MLNHTSLEDYYYHEHFKFELKDAKIITSVILIIIILFTLIGNLFICIAFCQYRRLRVITNYFVLSLAISDLLVASLSMPLFLSYELTEWQELPDWIDAMKLYQFLEIVDIVCCVSSIANLTAISIDRFFGIVMPLKHKAFMTETIALSCIFIVWIYSIMIGITKLIPNFTHYIVFNFIAGFALPLIVIIGAYVFIFLTVKKHSKRKFSLLKGNVPKGNVLAQEWMLARTILIVISLFVLCWAPFYVVQLLYQYCLSCTFIESRKFEYILTSLKLLHYFNSCCNPCVYGYFNVSFKQAFKTIFNNCLYRRKNKYLDINSNAQELSMLTGYTNVYARKRSASGFNSILSDVDQEALIRKITPVLSINESNPDTYVRSLLRKKVERKNTPTNASLATNKRKGSSRESKFFDLMEYYEKVDMDETKDSSPAFKTELRSVNKALDAVNSLTLGALINSTEQTNDITTNRKTGLIENPMNQEESLDIDDITRRSCDRFSDNFENIFNQPQDNIDYILAEAKESDL